jgi:hypothetical protein
MAGTTPKAMAEMALFLLRIAKKQLKNEDIRNVKLGDMTVDPEAIKSRIALPPNLRKQANRINRTVN